MHHMFEKATEFNGNISIWNVSNVNNMSYMFAEALKFNQYISSWNVSKVTNMSYMFADATEFTNRHPYPFDWNVLM